MIAEILTAVMAAQCILWQTCCASWHPRAVVELSANACPR